jgi:cytochrome c-type biogenesis protein CcsB
LEGIADGAFWLATALAAVATAAYWSQLLGLRVVMRRLATDAGEGPVVTAVEAAGNGARSSAAGRAATTAAWGTAAALVVWMVARWQAAGHAPWSNMYEFTVAFAGGITASYAVFERVYEGGARPARAMGAVVMPVVLAMLLAAAAFFPSDIEPLVAALRNPDLLAVHVAAMILAYGALSVSFAAAVLYLVQAGPGGAGVVGRRFARLPKASLLDDIAFRSVAVGFPLLALGIALGAYWANSAWGRYWGWDPKETSALVTWLIYGIYLHTHNLRGWAGARSAWVLVIGFGAVLFTYFAVNLWVSGLHSYAGV